MDRSSPASSQRGRGRQPTGLRRRTSRRQRTAPQLIIVPRIHSAATLAGATQKEAAPAPSVVIKMADLPRPPVSEVKRACPEKTGKPVAAAEPRVRLTLLKVWAPQAAAVAPQAEAGVGANEASGIVHRCPCDASTLARTMLRSREENHYVEHTRQRRGKNQEVSPACVHHDITFALPVGLLERPGRRFIRAEDFRLTRSHD